MGAHAEHKTMTILVISEFTFHNLDVPANDNEKDAFILNMLGAVQELVANGLGPAGGTTSVSITAINGIAILPNPGFLTSNFSTAGTANTSVITFEIRQTVRMSGHTDNIAEKLGEHVVRALDLKGARAKFETKYLHRLYGHFTLGKVATNLGDGSDPITASAAAVAKCDKDVSQCAAATSTCTAAESTCKRSTPPGKRSTTEFEVLALQYRIAQNMVQAAAQVVDT